MTEEDGEGWIDPSSEKTFFKMPNVTGNCGFGHIYWRNPYGKLHFLCSDADRSCKNSSK